jgi:hypothetical protein
VLLLISCLSCWDQLNFDTRPRYGCVIYCDWFSSFVLCSSLKPYAPVLQLKASQSFKTFLVLALFWDFTCWASHFPQKQDFYLTETEMKENK